MTRYDQAPTATPSTELIYENPIPGVARFVMDGPAPCKLPEPLQGHGIQPLGDEAR